MVDRFLLWLGAGVITAGMSAAMITGAGAAAAEAEGPSDPGGASTSESTNSPGAKEDSDDDKPSPKPANDDAEDEPANDDAEDEPATDDTEEPADVDEPDVADVDEPDFADAAEDDASNPPDAAAPEEEAVDDEKVRDDSDTAQQVTEQLDKQAAVVNAPDKKAVVEKDVETEKAVVEATAEEAVATVVEQTAVVVESIVPAIADPPESAAVAFAAPSAVAISSTATAPQGPTLLNVIGTLIFNLYSFATRVLGGPPVVPPGSTVTVRQSTLEIDCGDGYVVPADWYIPGTAEPPTRMIYLQHGFLAAGPWYSYTAATLAEQTNSIVVAPSLTSNFFACDACWLGAPPMHQAVADLFENENTALAESLAATGYTGSLPQRVVLVGHSLGGGLVAGTAGYMVDNVTVGKLRGVVMLDGVGLDDTMTASLGKVPLGIPIYQLAAPSYFWNQNGVGSAALQEARPDRFIGVVLEGGSHVDAMQGGNFLIQFSQQVVAGFSPPQNVEAAKLLMVGWINDMFVGTEDDGIYADPGEVIPIDTPAGQATAQALPSSLTKASLWNLLQPFVSAGMGFFTFEPTCAPAPEGTCLAA
jgi:pimeloyl-ACP methyl ester carboxylesterase